MIGVLLYDDTELTSYPVHVGSQQAKMVSSPNSHKAQDRGFESHGSESSGSHQNLKTWLYDYQKHFGVGFEYWSKEVVPVFTQP